MKRAGSPDEVAATIIWLASPSASYVSGAILDVGGAVSVSARTGYGLEALRAELSALLASLWVDVDVHVPYSAGELLARARERGTVELEYREQDVRVAGRIAPALAGELRAVARAWSETLREAPARTRDGH